MRACVGGWGTAVPELVTNAEMEQRRHDRRADRRTHRHSRRHVAAATDTTARSPSTPAPRIKHAGIPPDAIDLLIVATASPEQPIPHTGAFVGEGLGLRCGSFDLGAGCAGFVYMLVVGSSLLATGNLDHVLIVGSEILSRLIDPDDRATCILFGDGAAAAVLSRHSDDGPGVLAWDLGCDGSAAGLLEIRSVAAACRRHRRPSPPASST